MARGKKPAADGPDPAERRRSSARSSRRDKTPAERTEALLEAHRKSVEKTKAKATASGCPDHWAVDTSWAEELDAPFSCIAMGKPDARKSAELLDVWADFLVGVYLDRKQKESKASPGPLSDRG